MPSREHRPTEHTDKRRKKLKLQKRDYRYMVTFVLGATLLGVWIFGSAKIAVLPAFLFLLYVVDDFFGSVVSFILLVIGLVPVLVCASS